VLEDVAEVLEAAAPAFVVLELSKEVLRQIVGPRDEPYAAAGALGQRDCVAPEVVSVGLDVLPSAAPGGAWSMIRLNGLALDLLVAEREPPSMDSWVRGEKG
jgi:hypothetical protein